MPHLKRRFLAATCAAFAGVAQAHVPDEAPSPENGDAAWLVALLLLACVGYALGLARVWQRTHDRRQHAWRALAFGAGMVALAALLFGPIDALSTRSFAVHMIQHEGLMLLAAPLLVAGRALPLFLWSLPARTRLALGRATHARAPRAAWSWLTAPLTAWLLHAAALWLWHVPVYFNAALADPVVHEWQHVTFLAGALLFWHALLRRGAHGAQAMALVYLFTTTVHTGVLGALLTFARTPLYASMNQGLVPWLGLTPLEDQQLGGLIMWVPGAMVYVGMALWLAARWIGPERAAAGRYH